MSCGCCQPVSEQKLSDIILDAAYKYFKIEDKDKQIALKSLFEWYTQTKLQENLTEAFAKMNQTECPNWGGKP